MLIKYNAIATADDVWKVSFTSQQDAFVSVRVTRLCNEKQLIKYDKKIDLDSE